MLLPAQKYSPAGIPQLIVIGYLISAHPRIPRYPSENAKEENLPQSRRERK